MLVRARKTPPDGRVNNGGPRQGQPGQQYQNRSDLRTQKISVPPSAEYGQGEQLRRAQQAVPLAGAPAPPAPTGAGGVPPANPLAGIIPASSTPTLGQPSRRPDEPITAGMSFGPGRTPTPGQRPRDFASEEMVDRLRAIYLQYPTPELAELLDQAWL